jgi:pimeloyl-ACP methyl ester carboxylesterase
MRPRELWKLARAALSGSESSIFEVPAGFRGFRFSLDAMWPEVSRLNLLDQAPALEMPAFFLLGRKDHWVPAEISLAYFAALTAPSKELVWFEQSGHEPFVDEPAKFNAEIARLVRPVLPPNPPASTA